jgi:hypothetical protein
MLSSRKPIKHGYSRPRGRTNSHTAHAHSDQPPRWHPKPYARPVLGDSTDRVSRQIFRLEGTGPDVRQEADRK